MTRTFKELALCHLPDDEIREIFARIERGMTVGYRNDAGFFIWAQAKLDDCPVLTRLLQNQDVAYILFDVDVEPSPNLEIYE